MITRRGLLQAAVSPGLLAGLGVPAMAQKARRKGKSPSKKPESRPEAVEPDRRLADVLAPVRDDHRLPGLIGAILVGGRLASIGAVGLRKIGSDEPLRVTDQVHIGSCTKPMTATLLGMLVDQGKLTWGTTLAQVFPEQAKAMHPDCRSITLSHLLTHRAGLPHDVRWGRLPGRTPTEQRLSILTSLLTEPPLHPPGKQYEYSNVGYALAGLIAETIADRSWEDQLRERLFEPLEMTSAGFGFPGHRGSVEQPWGHRSVGGRVEPVQGDNAPSMGPAGTVHCTMADWGRFAALHMAAARGRARLLKASTFRALHTPPPGFEYAGGWLVCQRTWAGGTAYSHNGSNTMWYATVWLAPSINRVFLAATNQGDKTAEKAVDDAIVALIRAGDYLTRG